MEPAILCSQIHYTMHLIFTGSAGWIQTERPTDTETFSCFSNILGILFLDLAGTKTIYVISLPLCVYITICQYALGTSEIC